MSRNTEKKAVFFDADGTLCDMDIGVLEISLGALIELRDMVYDG